MLHVSYKTSPSRPLAALSGAFCLCTLALNRLLPECSSTLSWSQELRLPQTHTHCVPLPWKNKSFITYFISRISTHLQGFYSLFVSKSSIVRQTKQWIYFVIWDFTSPNAASPSTLPLRVWELINHLSSPGAQVTFLKRTLLGTLLVKI